MTEDTAWTFCQICRAECGMIAHLKGGRITKVEGDPEDRWSRGKLCAKGRNAPRVLYAEDRLRYPLLRKDRKAPLQRVSWQEAIEFIVDQTQRIKARYGGQALVFYEGTTARILDEMVLRRLAKLYGTPNVAGTWSVCVGPKMVAYNNTFGRPPMPWCDLQNSEYIMLWGANPPVTHLHRYHGITADVMAARERGAKLVVIDPRRTPIAAKADTHIQIKPATDLPLALGMINHIVKNDLYDSDFINAYTSGFEELADHITPYTPRWAEDITDVPAETIRQVTASFARTKPASLDRRQGVQHSRNATQTLRALAILLAITGNVDVQGGLMLTPYRRLKSLPVPGDLPRPEVAFWRDKFPLARDASASLPEGILSEEPYPLRGLIVIEGNPVSCFPNTGKVLQALNKLDLVVVNDLFMNETTELADVVLPGCTFLEKAEISVQSLRQDYPVRTRLPVVEPLYEALPEWKALSLLGRGLGYEEFFPFESGQELIQTVLERAGWTAHEPAVPTVPGRTLEKGFTTPTGRIELYSKSLEDQGYDALPTAPLDWPEDTAYPYYLITGARVPHFYHSQHRNIAALRKPHPEPVAEISPVLAEEAGVADGEEVLIETRAGSCPFKLKVTEGIHPRTVSIPHGWDGAQNANWLVDGAHCDREAATPPYRDVRCRIAGT